MRITRQLPAPIGGSGATPGLQSRGKRPYKRAMKVGPFSVVGRLLNPDGRTSLAKYLRQRRAALMAQAGENPPATIVGLVDRILELELRLEQLNRDMASTDGEVAVWRIQQADQWRAALLAYTKEFHQYCPPPKVEPQEGAAASDSAERIADQIEARVKRLMDGLRPGELVDFEALSASDRLGMAMFHPEKIYLRQTQRPHADVLLTVRDGMFITMPDNGRGDAVGHMVISGAPVGGDGYMARCAAVPADERAAVLELLDELDATRAHGGNDV